MSALALVLAVALVGCNPTNQTLALGGSGVASTATFEYTGADGAWIEIRVAGASSARVEVSGTIYGVSAFCLGDGPYGVDQAARCGSGNGQYGVSVPSPYRAAWTEGVGRGWKRVISVQPRARFYATARSDRDAQVTLEVRTVDGNGNLVGDIEVWEGW